MRFENSEEVYKFMNNPNDAWSQPMVENYIDEVGLALDEEFDVEELNEWLEKELTSLQEGFEKYLDNGQINPIWDNSKHGYFTPVCNKTS